MSKYDLVEDNMTRASILLATILLYKITLIERPLVEGWSYTDTHDWPGHCSDVSRPQSPIKLVTSNQKCNSRDGLVFGSGFNQELNMSVFNTGHTVRFEVPLGAKDVTILRKIHFSFWEKVSMSWRKVWKVQKTLYNFDSLHLHWGGSNSVRQGRGSEHQIDSSQTVLEIHIEAYESNYTDKRKAKEEGKNLVVGILYKIAPNSSNALENLINAVDKVRLMNAEAFLSFRLKDILPSIASFYMYNGTLTSPNCYDASWFVYKHAQTVTSEQMSRLKEVTGDKFDSKIGNFRHIQHTKSDQVIKCNRP
jgi:carbonic anhydrase